MTQQKGTLIAADETPYRIDIHRSLPHGQPMVLCLLPVVALDIGGPKLVKYDYLDTFNEMSSKGRLAVSFYITNNGKAKEYKKRGFVNCMDRLEYQKRRDSGYVVGTLCGFYEDCRDDLSIYFNELFVKEREAPKHFKKQPDLLGRMTRTVTDTRMNEKFREVSDKYVFKHTDEIDFTRLDESQEEIAMRKIMEVVADLCVPVKNPLIDAEIDQIYGLKEAYLSVLESRGTPLVKI